MSLSDQELKRRLDKRSIIIDPLENLLLQLQAILNPRVHATRASPMRSPTTERRMAAPTYAWRLSPAGRPVSSSLVGGMFGRRVRVIVMSRDR